MLPAQAAASATALREKRATEEGGGPECDEALRETSSLFLDRAWLVHMGRKRGVGGWGGEKEGGRGVKGGVFLFPWGVRRRRLKNKKKKKVTLFPLARSLALSSPRSQLSKHPPSLPAFRALFLPFSTPQAWGKVSPERTATEARERPKGDLRRSTEGWLPSFRKRRRAKTVFFSSFFVPSTRKRRRLTLPRRGL